VDRLIRLRDTGLDWRAVEDQVIVLDSAASEYLGVNRTGAVLWHRIAEGANRKALIGVLEAEGADAAGARRDVDLFVASLDQLGLLSP